MTKLMVGVACAALGGLCLSARADEAQWTFLYTVEDGATHKVGQKGDGTNNSNSNSNSALFKGSATVLGVDQDYSQWNIWGAFFATNGVLTLDPRPLKNGASTPNLNRSVVLGEKGSMRVYPTSNGGSVVSFGDGQTSPRYPVIDITDLKFINADGSDRSGRIAFAQNVAVVNMPKATATLTVGQARCMLALGCGAFVNCGVNLANLATNLVVASTDILPESSAGALQLGNLDLTLQAYDYALPSPGGFITINKEAFNRWGETEAHSFVIGSQGRLTVRTTDDLAFSGSVSSAGGTVRLYGDNAAADKAITYTFANLAGTVNFDAESSRKPIVVVNGAAAGTRLYDARMVVLQIANTLEHKVIVGKDGTWYVFPLSDGKYDLDGIDAVQTLTGGADIGGGSYIEPCRLGTVKIAVGSDETLSTLVGANDQPKFVVGGGTLTLSASVRNQALLWFDPSDTNTIRKLGEATPDWVREKDPSGFASQTRTYSFKSKSRSLIEAVADVRTRQTEWCLRNTRNYDGLKGSGKAFENIASVYPFLMEGEGLNGLSYWCTGNTSDKRRLQPSQSTLDVTSTAKPSYKTLSGVGTVTMVFGSQLGGGKALVGIKDDSLNRGNVQKTDAQPTKDAPIANANFTGDIWVDGVKSDYTATLSGGWQVITLDLTGHEIEAFGWAYDAPAGSENYKLSGYQNYGEILVFGSVLSDGDRIEVEKYLAAKWGITGYQAEATAPETAGKAAVYGTSGTVAVAGRLNVSGTFSGSFSVSEGAVLQLPARTYTPTIPSEGLVGWFDPSEAGALLSINTENSKPAIAALWPHGYTGDTLGHGTNFFYGVGSRRPFPAERTAGFGVTRRWVDFDHPQGHVGSTSDGNTLRLKAWSGDINDSAYSDGASDKKVDVRTVVFVSDSFRAGGNPLLEGVATSGAWGLRLPYQKTDPLSTPIWVGATSAVTGGKTRLNGVEIDGTKTPYTGEAEVLSVVTTGNCKLGNLGYIYSSEMQSGYGEMLGEVLFYSTALDATQVKTIEDYLLYKWMGVAPEGYGDFTGATVTGAGTVAAKCAADLPTFGTGFTGAVQLTESSDFAFTYKDKAIADALDFSGGSYAFADGAKVTVHVATRRRPGEYTLITAGSLGGTVPELVLDGAEADKGNEKLYSLAIKDNKLVLVVKRFGFGMIFR